MKETKNATIRLPQEIADWLTKDGKSINQAVIDTVNTLQSIRLISTTELRGIFSAKEWKFLADSFNGIMINDSIRYNVQMLIAQCEDSAIYDSLDKKYDVDMEVFKKKLSSLHSANVDALYARIEDFLNADKHIDIEDWAKF